jgi:hypothetical protein
VCHDSSLCRFDFQSVPRVVRILQSWKWYMTSTQFSHYYLFVVFSGVGTLSCRSYTTHPFPPLRLLIHLQLLALDHTRCFRLHSFFCVCVCVCRHHNAGQNQYTERCMYVGIEPLKMLQLNYLVRIVTDQNYIYEGVNGRLNSGNACYHSAQDPFTSRLLPRNENYLSICRCWSYG